MKKIKTLPTWSIVTLAFIAYVLLSPKWLVPPAAWFAPGLLVWLLRGKRFWRAFLLCYGVLLTSSLVANYQVMPFPAAFFVIMVVIISIQASIPFLINYYLWEKVDGFARTLILPATFVIYEYITSFGGGGTWGLIAYTQADNVALIQFTSVTGIWGLSFVIYWWAAFFNWMMERDSVDKWKWEFLPIILFVGVMLFGYARINSYFERPRQTIRAAGITGNNLVVAKSIYEDATGNKLQANLEELTQTSAELQEINKGLTAFIENPYDQKFERSRKHMNIFRDSILRIAEREALAGAKIILLSEALLFTTKRDEGLLIEEAKLFAKRNKVFFLLAMASFIPGKVEIGTKYIENKAILISPEGEVLNTFFKNKPVPVVEGSVPGDGSVPVIETPLGRLATSICYDADFPQLMRQTGEKRADILLLPSGDWKEVSPYHAQMARMRAVENGFSLFRPVSGAQSIAFDYMGRPIASRNYFDQGDKILVAYLPSKGITTIYSRVGDVVVFISGLLLVGLMIHAYRKRGS